MGVNLKGQALDILLNHRHQSPHPVDGEQPPLVFEVDDINIGRADYLSCLLGVELIGVHRANGI